MSPIEVQKIIGKEIVQVMDFQCGDDFEGYNKAVEFLKKNGISYGSMQRSCPIGVAIGDFDISKWRNLGEDVKELDGLMIATNGSFRTGNVLLYLSRVAAKVAGV